MSLIGLENTTGTTISIVAAVPASETLAAYEALSYEQIVGVVTFGAWGDTEEDVSEPILSDDRLIHTNGVADGGTTPIAVQHRATDAGSDVVYANGGSNTAVTIKKLYSSGDAEYATGIISSPRQRSAESSSIRGYTFNLMANTKVFRATAAEIAALP